MSTLPPSFAVLALAGTAVIRVEEHLEWAEGIAKRRARKFKFRRDGAEEDAVVAEAQLAVCQLARKFRPDLVPAGGNAAGQFRGWACQWVLTACTRECRRMLNAGTFDATSRVSGHPVRSIALSRLQAPLVSPEPDEAPAEPFCVCDTSHG